MIKTKQTFLNNKANSSQLILSCDMETDDFLIKLGKHIKSLRQAKNMTVKELASRTGKTQATIIRLEKGNDNIKILTLKNVLKELNSDFSTLFLSTEDVAFYETLQRFATKQNNSWRLSKKILNVILNHYNSL